MNQILLIDDEEGIRDTWTRFHEYTEPVFRGRLEMEVAPDIEQGMQKILHTQYDAVILDLKFLGQGTDDTITFIFENHDKLPPIIVLTGDEDIYVRRRCMIAGASDFWTKRDAQAHRDLFFKSLYNRYLSRYGDGSNTP